MTNILTAPASATPFSPTAGLLAFTHGVSHGLTPRDPRGPRQDPRPATPEEVQAWQDDVPVTFFSTEETVALTRQFLQEQAAEQGGDAAAFQPGVKSVEADDVVVSLEPLTFRALLAACQDKAPVRDDFTELAFFGAEACAAMAPEIDALFGGPVSIVGAAVVSSLFSDDQEDEEVIHPLVAVEFGGEYYVVSFTLWGGAIHRDVAMQGPLVERTLALDLVEVFPPFPADISSADIPA